MGREARTVSRTVRRLCRLCGCMVLLLGTPLAGPANADLAAGKVIATRICQQCHGVDGLALVDEAPNLAGQKRSYLARQLRAFRAGERSDPKMSPTAIKLSDEDIADVAEWYSSIEFSVTPPE